MVTNPIFKLGRTLVLSFVTLMALVWVVLLSVVAFAWWDIIGTPERSFISLMISVNVITVVGLPILLLIPFRHWLDAARILLLIMAHVGSAAGFTAWVPKFTCSTQTGAPSTCIDITNYISVFSWAIPALLIVYSIALCIYWYINRHQDMTMEDTEKSSSTDMEKDTKSVAPTPATPIFDQFRASTYHPAVRPEWERLPRVSPPPRLSVPPPPRNQIYQTTPARTTPPRISVSIPHPRTSVPRLSLPPLPPHMSWNSPPSPSVYSSFPPSPAASSYTASPIAGSSQSRKSLLPPTTPTRRTTMAPVSSVSDRMSRLSDLVAEAAIVKASSDTSSEDSASTTKENKRRLVKSMSRGHAL